MISPKRILVPLNGGPVDDEAVDLACYLAKRDHARLYAIHVIEVKRELPLETELPGEVKRGEEILRRAEQAARKWKQGLETELLQARDAGTAIAEEAERRGAELIIMGMEYREHFDRFYQGETVSYVLGNAPCRVCVCRQAMP